MIQFQSTGFNFVTIKNPFITIKEINQLKLIITSKLKI